jgi:hypothetical protein
MDHPSTYRVVYVEPGKPACEKEIGSDLKSLQEAVGGGLIELVYPHRDNTLIVCNDEGKLIGMEGNRRLDTGSIIAGPFFICGCDTGRFTGLTEKQQQTYLRQFHYPEQFARINGEIRSMCYKPDRDPNR